jgi:hypothetical protein
VSRWELGHLGKSRMRNVAALLFSWFCRNDKAFTKASRTFFFSYWEKNSLEYGSFMYIFEKYIKESLFQIFCNNISSWVSYPLTPGFQYIISFESITSH